MTPYTLRLNLSPRLFQHPQHLYTISNPPDFTVEHQNDPEPEYHPGPEYPDYIDDPDPVNLEDENSVSGSPAGLTHSFVGDNFDYPEIWNLDEEEATPEDYHYLLDDNVTLIRLLESYYSYAEQTTDTLKERYLTYLSRVKSFHALNNRFPPGDLIRTTLFYFPCTRFWARVTNELLDEGPISDVRIYFRYLRCMVRQHM